MLVIATKERTAGVPLEQVGRSWKEIVEPVQPFLKQVANALAREVEAFDPEIAPYARYALTNQGKHLRPALVAFSGRAFSDLNESLLRVAVVIEMVHLATLVHDDVMDVAEIRRCRPTLAANWGNEISVLVGDCLFAHAVTLAASFPTPEICRAVARSTNTVCSGEIIQTNQRGNFTLTREDYYKAVGMKTGELFALSCDLGAALAGATPAERKALRDYGFALGTAYQIYDDCMDFFGSEAVAGKSLGTDLAHAKMTLPLLLVLEQADHSDRKLLQMALKPREQSDMTRIFELFEKYDALNGTRRVVYEHLDQARRCLDGLRTNDGVEALAALADFLAQQTGALGVQ